MSDRRQKRSSVLMLGLRGINGPQGGVETHVGALAPLLVERGWGVDVLARSGYVPPGRQQWKGVGIEPAWAPRSQKFEALAHTGLGVALATLRRPDIVHIHAIGPALLTPMARLARLRTVVTHHGYDYNRDKWGRLARTALRLGEAQGMRWADAAVAVADTIARDMEARYGRKVRFLPNGVFMPDPHPDPQALAQFGLDPGRYVLNVSRIVPEKRQLDLIAAYASMGDPNLKLALVGAADHADPYSAAVWEAARATPGVVMTGFQSGETLAALFAHAGLFVLPSSHEGMPIALLEAMSHGLPVLASAIDANLAIGLHAEQYFALGDQRALAQAMSRVITAPPSQAERAAQLLMVRQRFGWEQVADALSGLYASLMRARRADEPLQVRAAQSRSMMK